MTSKLTTLRAYCMWLVPLSFFAFQFILRLWPSLMMDKIMLQFGIDATAFGLLAALYYYGYAGMQLPLALLLDKLGPRLVVFCCATLCGLATYVFTTTTSWPLALTSRFLVGVGSAVGFLASSAVIAQWFGKAQYSRMVGFTFTGGLLGAIYGGKPVSLLIQEYGGQSVAFTLASVSLAIGLMSLVLLRSPSKSSTNNESLKLADIKKLFKQPALWLLALANMLMVGSLEGFADVWGVNFLVHSQHLSQQSAAQLVSMIFVGMLFGGPLLAYISQKTSDYVVLVSSGVLMSAIMFSVVLQPASFNPTLMATTLFVLGILCCYQVIVFSAGCNMVSKALLGVTVAFLNSINMLGGSLFHSCIGKLMDYFWSGELIGAQKTYSVFAYQQALLMIPFASLVGALLMGLTAWHYYQSTQTQPGQGVQMI